jgi:PAS domain S-box-containing protein
MGNMSEKSNLPERYSCKNAKINKVTSQVLRNDCAQLAAVIKGAGAGIWDWNLKTGVTLFSERCGEMVGYTIEELQPLTLDTWSDLCHPEDLKLSNMMLEEHFNGKLDCYDSEVRLKHKNGHWVWIKDSGKIIEWDDNGEPFRMCGTYVDITEQKLVEEQLKYRLDVEKLVTGISSSFVGLGTDEVDPAINNALKKIGQFTDVDRSYVFLIREDDTELMDNTHEWCGEGISSEQDHLQNLPCCAFPWWMGKLCNFEHINFFQLSDLPLEASVEREILQTQNILSLLAIPIHFKKELLGFMGFDSVKVKKKWLDEDISLLVTVGEVIGSALNHCKNERKLITAKERAEEADKLKTSFLQNLSHEIRTPLNGIMGFSKLLGNSNLSESKQANYINVIHDCGKQLIEIIENLIRISTIESGNERITKSKMVINEMIFDLMTTHSPKTKVAGLNMYSNPVLSDKCSEVYTDAVKLRQVLTNLIDNALKFTHSGIIELGYTLENDFLKFYVKDTGIGIAPEMHDTIFERFRQIEYSTSRKYGGNGLGLAISKAYVELLGGRMWLESSIGKGSTFYFTVPYAPLNVEERILTEEVLDTTGKSKPLPFKEVLDTTEKSKTILFVEDEEINYLLFKEILMNSIYTIIYACNGKEAVSLFKKHPEIDLVLMDIKMTGMNGYEATRKIKALRKDVSVIAQTAYAFNNDFTKAFAAGCDDCITKPFVKNDVMTKIEKWI